MKKLAIALFVALLGFAFTAPAFALDNQFGGYWRVRMVHQEDFNGKDDDANDLQRADTRTRLYYTAVLNDNLKFVNKFEMNAVWGDNTAIGTTGNDGYGDVGADGLSVLVKNSYIDFNLGSLRTKIGTQSATIQRGFIFADDFSGIVASTSGFTFLYGKFEENGADIGDDAQAYHANYMIDLDTIKITPNVTFADLTDSDYTYYVGLDIDGAAGGLGYWATLIYNGGQKSADPSGTNREDINAFLVAAGGNVAISDMFGIHFQGFYASGDDDTDSDEEAFQTIPGHSYYWSEIMGLGTFDQQNITGGPGDQISNVWALNCGVDFQVTEKLKLTGDVWYARLAEDDANGEDYLGTEIDLKASYQLVEGLNVDLVAAYLFAGDANSADGDNEENPYELGTQFSISF